MLLETVENFLSYDSEAAEEAMAGLHEAAAEAGGAAAAASTAAVARGGRRWLWALVLQHQQLAQRQRVMLTNSEAQTIHVVF